MFSSANATTLNATVMAADRAVVSENERLSTHEIEFTTIESVKSVRYDGLRFKLRLPARREKFEQELEISVSDARSHCWKTATS